jgi:hypothetical protein
MAGDDNHRARLTTREEGADEFGFRFDIESGGGLIHEDDRVLTKESAGQGDALALTTREIGTSLRQRREDSIRQRGPKFVQAKRG